MFCNPLHGTRMAQALMLLLPWVVPARLVCIHEPVAQAVGTPWQQGPSCGAITHSRTTLPWMGERVVVAWLADLAVVVREVHQGGPTPALTTISTSLRMLNGAVTKSHAHTCSRLTVAQAPPTVMCEWACCQLARAQVSWAWPTSC
jgi:hypothetical protein